MTEEDENVEMPKKNMLTQQLMKNAWNSSPLKVKEESFYLNC